MNIVLQYYLCTILLWMFDWSRAKGHGPLLTTKVSTELIMSTPHLTIFRMTSYSHCKPYCPHYVTNCEIPSSWKICCIVSVGWNIVAIFAGMTIYGYFVWNVPCVLKCEHAVVSWQRTTWWRGIPSLMCHAAREASVGSSVGAGDWRTMACVTILCYCPP